MRVFAALATACLTACCSGAFANDTMATLGAGGLVFIQTEEVRMLSEDLYVSPSEVRVRYEFRNENETDTSALVAFPLPEITGSPDFMVSIPTEDPQNIFGFETTFNGTPVEAKLHQYVFAENIEYTDYLRKLGIPLAPFGGETQQVINALGEEVQLELFRRGLVVPLDYSNQVDGPMIREYYPAWTLRSTYSWEADFPAGETVVVEHRYRPSVGGTVAVTFLGEPSEDYDPQGEARKKYCVDDQLMQTLTKSLASPEETWTAPYVEKWMQYVWTTGRNWGGPIDKFRLVVDKGNPQNLVSFCWDGEVKKIGPTSFEATAEDFYPPYDRELEIMILERQQPVTDLPT